MTNDWAKLVTACADAEGVNATRHGFLPTPMVVLAHAVTEHLDAPMNAPIIQEHMADARAFTVTTENTKMYDQSIKGFVDAILAGDIQGVDHFATRHFNDEHDLFMRSRNSFPGLLHPWSGLIRAYLRLTQDVEPNERSRRILPGRLAMSTDENRVPKLFSPPAHVSSDGNGVLPLFGIDTPPIVAWPLELYRMGGGSDARKGRGISMPLRIFTEAVLAVQLKDRDGHPKAFNYSLKKLLALLYPSGPPSAGVYWPRLKRAAQVLDATRVPVYNEATGRHSLRRIVSMGAIPGSPTWLEDDVRFIVDLPRGSDRGPQVPDSPPSLGNQGRRRLEASPAPLLRLVPSRREHASTGEAGRRKRGILGPVPQP